MFNRLITSRTYKNYVNKLSIVCPFSDIPNKYRQNKDDPFKPFFLCPNDLATPYIHATTILSKYNIDEIKEIRSCLSRLAITHAKAMADAIKIQHDKDYTFKEFLKYHDLLIYYLNTNIDQTDDKKFSAMDLYAVMSIKFIKRAVMANIRERKAKIEWEKRQSKSKNKESIESFFINTGIELKHNYCPNCLHKETRKSRLGGSYINNIVGAMDSLFIGNLIDTRSKNLLKIKKRMKGISIFQQKADEDKRYILNMASELWARDEEKLLRTGYVANLICNTLKMQNNDKYAINTIKSWIKEVKPDYADNRGRETKKNRELLFELYKLKVF